MSTSTNELFIYGAGGNGMEIVSMADSGCHAGYGRLPWRVAGFIDDTPGFRGKDILGVPCLGSFEEVKAQRAGQETWCHVAIGDNEARRDVAARVESAGWKPATVIHSTASVSREVTLGEGCFVALGVTISPQVRIGKHVLLNTHAAIGHHAIVGDFAQISLRASVLGHGYVDRGAMIGAHAVVMSGVTVGAWATVAVGTPALRSVKPGDTITLPLAKTLYKRKTMPD